MENLRQIKSNLEQDQQRDLLSTARLAGANAHVPYSHFHVGAAVLDNQNRIFSGCNVENSSFGLTMCAERNAVGAAVTAGSKRLLAMLIYTPTETLTPPCGACRQVLSEFGDMEVHMCNHDGKHMVTMLSDLLPASFRLEAAMMKT